MDFIDRPKLEDFFRNKSVAIVGSAPSVLNNEEGFIDSHDLVVRVNNFKLSKQAGHKIDVHYSFYGNSIRTTQEQLDGVKLCMCKCPDANTIESDWHERNGKKFGTDFRWIYSKRVDWWFCDVYVPSKERFITYFDLLNHHIPTTGFQCILEILDLPAKSIYITGFDFFASKIHNIDEPWREGDPNDPIGHDTKAEKNYILSLTDGRVTLDNRLQGLG